MYPTCAHEAFLEGHIDAFETLGGIPARHIRYDNPTSAVLVVLHGGNRRRKENDRWVLLKSHYESIRSTASPASPAHTRRKVWKAKSGGSRNHLTPMPEVDSLEEFNDKIKQREASDDRRRIADKFSTIGQDYAAERNLLAVLPIDRFDPVWCCTRRWTGRRGHPRRWWGQC